MKLTYNDDEVKKFHPQIQSAVCKYMKNNKLDKQFTLKHHENVPGVDGIPDFILVNSNNKWVFVIEVKRTPVRTKSPETWNPGEW